MKIDRQKERHLVKIFCIKIKPFFLLFIDQVEQTINLTWVQPRVLDREQVKTIMAKISTLNASIVSMEKMIENNAGEILTM